MVVGKFDIYDIIVDIFPGVVMILLLIPVFASEEQLLEIGFGTENVIIFVTISYIVGRTIQGISSPFEDSLNNILIKMDPSFYRSLESNGLFNTVIDSMSNMFMTVRRTTLSLIGPQVKPEHYFTHEDDLPHGVDSDIIGDMDRIIYEITDELENIYNIDVGIKSNRDLDHLQEICQSILYNEDVIYKRHKLLLDFYKSMSVVFCFSAAIYFLSVVWVLSPTEFQLFDHTPIWSSFISNNPIISILIFILYIILFIVFFRLRRAYSDIKWRSLIHDTLFILKKQSSD